MILVTYDGSADAQAAIDRAAELMPGTEATVLTIWEPFIGMLTRTGSLSAGIGMASDYGDSEKIDADVRAAALATATDGAQRATAAGLVAQPRVQTRHADVADTVLTEAAAIDADVIVMGTRGRSGVKSFLLGSVSHAVVQHADRAVLVVPSSELAERRHEHLNLETMPA